ncbi:MAG TPA: hypothetical protein VMW85_05985 [Methanomassiliicoccales archaeon]|nr:hypothetical protein [Methanomassiliicoccales archaeon]
MSCARTGGSYRAILRSHEGEHGPRAQGHLLGAQDLDEFLIMIKDSNNEDLALQVGLVRDGGWNCPSKR